ncbi:MAG TPA: response regulator [Thermoanaerobaculia bacterium]|nr:response regulator [Thermoanaerobaculia bacterium]
MTTLRLELLGDFRMVADGGLITVSAKKAQALLAYLAVKPAQLVSRDKIASLLWGSFGPEQARQSLRQMLSTLRRELKAIAPSSIDAEPVLVEENDFLALDAQHVACDVVEFETGVAGGTEESLKHAMEIYTGDFLEGFELDEDRYDQWVLGERDRLHRMALRVHNQLLELLTRRDAIDEAIATAQHSLRIDPLQEPVHRALMRLYAQSGDPVNALQQYDILARSLKRELNVNPDSETQKLQREIAAMRSRRTSAEPEGNGRKQVLIVEDNQLSRDLANAVLSSAGYAVVVAQDGAEALMVLGRERIDLMLLDIDLPFIDGHSLLQAVREKGIEIPAIVISGLPGEEPEVRALEIGAVDFIRKPVKNSVLLARVARALKE